MDYVRHCHVQFANNAKHKTSILQSSNKLADESANTDPGITVRNRSEVFREAPVVACQS